MCKAWTSQVDIDFSNRWIKSHENMQNVRWTFCNQQLLAQPHCEHSWKLCGCLCLLWLDYFYLPAHMSADHTALNNYNSPTELFSLSPPMGLSGLLWCHPSMNVLVKQVKKENSPNCSKKFSALFQNIQIKISSNGWRRHLVVSWWTIQFLTENPGKAVRTFRKVQTLSGGNMMFNPCWNINVYTSVILQ